MRISELARRGEVSTATVKYYLREGLLPAGQLTSATQAQYGDEHVDRLRLVRALLASGLTVATAKDVLRHLDSPPTSVIDLLAEVQTTLTPVAGEFDRSEMTVLLERWGFEPCTALDGPVSALARALAVAKDAGLAISDEMLDGYADAARQIAEVDIAGIPTDSAQAAVEYVVLGTILMEPVLLAMRRLAEADASVRRFS